MSVLRALLVQPELRWQDPAENRRHLEQLIESALENNAQGADLVFLPETFTTGFLGDFGSEPEAMDGPTVAWMHELATRYDAAIGGSVIIGDKGARMNRFLFATPEGDLAHYDKRHLFGYGGEDQHYKAGSMRAVFDYRDWRISPQVCYDLRFPVWCRNLGDYDLQVFVANWPAKRVNAWASLLRARAIENQACVIGINRVGRDGKGIEYPGLSVAYDGLGNELAALGDSEGTAIATLNLDDLHELRNHLPFLDDADSFRLL